MGYHLTTIKKGVIGEFSKIQEEWDELIDAKLQDNKLLMLCELADLIGAIDLYVKNNFKLTLEELIKMKNSTESAFKDGTRK
jgi:phosphoribosyl-ATP pyrophosphohydrolase